LAETLRERACADVFAVVAMVPLPACASEHFVLIRSRHAERGTGVDPRERVSL
jgi:hypothetical protein